MDLVNFIAPDKRRLAKVETKRVKSASGSADPSFGMQIGIGVNVVYEWILERVRKGVRETNRTRRE
jgi:hypothetical protein